MLILIAALGGAIVSGGLLLLSHHLQGKRDDRRRQRDFERATRGESLDQIQHVIDLGAKVSIHVDAFSRGGEITPDRIEDFYQLAVASNRAQISCIAIGGQQIDHELAVLSSLMERMTPQSADFRSHG